MSTGGIYDDEAVVDVLDFSEKKKQHKPKRSNGVGTRRVSTIEERTGAKSSTPTKAGRKQKRASKGNAETEEGIRKSVHLVTRLKSRLPRLEVFAP